jgi:hypothetical protein
MKKRTQVALLTICLTLGGCVGVTRVPQRTRGQRGTIQNIDLSFLKIGQTTQAEVREKLKAVDTGVESDHFFVGRWDTSKWGGWAVLVGYGGGAGGAERFWHEANLVVEFDDKKTITGYEVFPDKALVQKLGPVAREAKLSLPEHLDAILYTGTGTKYTVPVTLTLSSTTLEVLQTSKAKKPLHVTVPAEELTSIGGSVVYRSVDPVIVYETLHFANNLKKFGGPRGNRLYVQLTVSHLVKLLAFAQSSRKMTG